MGADDGITIILMGLGGRASAASFDNDLVRVGDALLPCNDDRVRLEALGADRRKFGFAGLQISQERSIGV